MFMTSEREEKNVNLYFDLSEVSYQDDVSM